ncbi:helix-turn-helix transcriptional regulator [Phormidium sp. CLA17]|uniref:helix-turn-helix domain-containing protein n=1 Tax=Leptolyngbya sp. Cla-17 TaxID=2803751 RepID=UPI00149132F6|nr:helix-turn-helix transcriptional regulator [Leptolyngbya sp. Cla-17]MBM0743838.1 helix-turn-helix transcriptional regulator [Leptolyngbya sp. Cla-17]
MKGGSKYQPLLEYLLQEDRPEIVLTFADIETLMGAPLPESARHNRAWWSNRSKGALQSTAWMSAGYLVKDLNFLDEQVTFHKPPQVYTVPRVNDQIQWNGELVKALRSHMGLTQAGFAKELCIRQQTVSEWEKGVYEPSRASSNYLTLVAEKATFKLESGDIA